MGVIIICGTCIGNPLFFSFLYVFWPKAKGYGDSLEMLCVKKRQTRDLPLSAFTRHHQ